MSVTYTYDGVTPAPCFSFVMNRVMYGAVGGQTDIGVLSWSSDTQVLTVEWGHELTAGEKASLDVVVDDSRGKVRVYKSRNQIMDEIFWDAVSFGGMARVQALILGLNKLPSLIVALDNGNYPLSYWLLGYALSQGWITQDDHDLAISKIPPNEFEEGVDDGEG